MRDSMAEMDVMVGESEGHDAAIERIPFLWNQQRYLLENIRLSDTKAGFLLTISAAVLSASLSPSSRFGFHLSNVSSVRSYIGAGVFVLGVAALAGAAIMSAWSIKPRIMSSAQASPVSWVNVARFRDLESFRAAHRGMTKVTAAELLCEQVFGMSKICVRKHQLVSTAIKLILAGGLLVVVAVVVG